MSLVFLKNKQISKTDDTLFDKPYHFQNFFHTPLRIKKNSQVAYVSSVLTKSEEQSNEMEGDNNDKILYCCIGIPLLNMTYEIDVSEYYLSDNDTLALALSSGLNFMQTQSGFLEVEDDITNKSPGFTITYSDTTQKFTIEGEQRTLEKINRGGEVPNYSLGDWTPNWKKHPSTTFDITGTGNIVITYEPGTGTINPSDIGWAVHTRDGFALNTLLGGQGGWTTGYSNTEIRRNGGSIIFHTPNMRVAANPVPPAQYFGLTSRHFVEPNGFNGMGDFYPNLIGINGGIPLGGTMRSICPFVIGIEIRNKQDLFPPVAGGEAFVVMYEGNSDGSTDTMNGMVVKTEKSAAIALAPNRPHFFKLEWTSPYQISVYHSTNYDETTGLGDWFIKYNMADDNLHIPSWYGDMVGVSYLNYTFGDIPGPPTDPKGGAFIQMRGEFSYGQGYKDLTSLQVPYEGIPGIYLDSFRVIESNDPTIETLVGGLESKNIRMVVGKLQADELAFFGEWNGANYGAGGFQVYNSNYFAVNNPDITTYKTLGISGDAGSIMLKTPAGGTPIWNNYLFIGQIISLINTTYKGVHIQLNNLPITCYNGITANQSKDIAIVPVYDEQYYLKVIADASRPQTFSFNYQIEKNWIDINNAEDINLNFIEVYITDDDNKPARFLSERSNIVIIFRQKPATDTRY